MNKKYIVNELGQKRLQLLRETVCLVTEARLKVNNPYPLWIKGFDNIWMNHIEATFNAETKQQFVESCILFFKAYHQFTKLFDCEDNDYRFLKKCITDIRTIYIRSLMDMSEEIREHVRNSIN